MATSTTAVIDTNILIHGASRRLPYQTVLTTPAATAEIQSQDAANRFNASNATVMEPSKSAVETINKTVEDANLQLSTTDRALVALAYQTSAVLVTDDRSMQEAAHRLDITVEGIQQETVSTAQNWKYVCERCRTKIDKDSTCPQCSGSPIRISQ